MRRKRKLPVPVPVHVHVGPQVSHALLEGVRAAARVIGVTYGPQGRTVMLDRPGGILSTKDGASVAWEVEPVNPLWRLGARAVQAACSKVNKTCGDGTSTVALLIQAILAESLRWVAAGEHPALLAKALQEVSADLLDNGVLEMLRLPVEDEDTLFHVAHVASNRDADVAHALVDMVGRVGSSGLVVIEEGHGRSVEVSYKKGLEFDRGWESSDFAEGDGISRIFDVALVVLIDGRLTKMAEVVPFLEEATQFPHPLVIVSRGCFGEALKMLVTNDRKLKRADGTLFGVVATRAPGREDKVRGHLEDLAALTGASIVDPTVFSFAEISSEMFGTVQTVSVKSTSATFTAFPDKFPGIEARVLQLRREMEACTHSYDVETLRTRIARLSDGFGVMRVGGVSQTEMRERRGRIEDAFHAVRKAVEGGVVPGGGITYLALSESLRQVSSGSAADAILVEALRAPLCALVGKAASAVLERILEQSKASPEGLPGWEYGWDGTTEEFRDLRSPLLCDPHDVVREVIAVAVSTATTLLSASCAITKARVN